MAEGGPALPEAIKRPADETARGRMATEADMAHTVLFLAADLSAAQTGVIIPVGARPLLNVAGDPGQI